MAQGSPRQPRAAHGSSQERTISTNSRSTAQGGVLVCHIQHPHPLRRGGGGRERGTTRGHKRPRVKRGEGEGARVKGGQPVQKTMHFLGRLNQPVPKTLHFSMRLSLPVPKTMFFSRRLQQPVQKAIVFHKINIKASMFWFGHF